MRVKVLLLVAALIGLGAMFSLVAVPAELAAQDRGGRMEPRPDRGQMQQRAGELKKRAEENFQELCAFLALNDDQRKQARKLFEKRQEKMQEAMKDARRERSERSKTRDKMAESYREFRQNLEKILSEEQRAKLEKWVDDRQGSAGPRGQVPGSSRLERAPERFETALA